LEINQVPKRKEGRSPLVKRKLEEKGNLKKGLPFKGPGKEGGNPWPKRRG